MSNRTEHPEGTVAADPESPSPPRNSRVPADGNPTATDTSDTDPRIPRAITRGRPFQPGNPGRPKGARNKATRMIEAMFAGEAEEIGRRAIELAKEGRVTAVKMVMDRACPIRKAPPAEGLELPAVNSPADALAAMSAVTAALAAGTISTDEARDLSNVFDAYRKMHELVDIDRRIARLERHQRHEGKIGATYDP